MADEEKTGPGFWLRRRASQLWHSLASLWRWLNEERRKQDPLEYFFLCVFVVMMFVVAAGLGFIVADKWHPTFIPQTLTCTTYDLRRTPEACYGWDDFRSLMFGLAGAVGAVFGLYQLKNSATRTRLARIDTGTNREAERNERFVKAVELLKDSDDSVRMGGIYALERLALEDGGAYYKTVVEVLSAYIRHRTNAQDEEGAYTYLPRKRWIASAKNELNSKNPRTAFGPTEPVRAAMKALSRLTTQRPKSVTDALVHLRGAWLDGFDGFGGFDISGWVFERCMLRGANLGGVNLAKASLWEANLEGTFMYEVNLEGAILSRAILGRATYLSWSQINRGVWPTGIPPVSLPDGMIADDFDKSWCTDPDDPMKLLPREKWGTPPERKPNDESQN
ncbi:pentapeptide repeat-containing protein [Parvularcula sp. LCG005]|uniref:pentapeptide repeat-containing protein n=1 Tax=Parvularcula sp. LCG005 TaxID=3078805 RepID=UPI0029428973|nr:pentapeptide repeat-containing protein [Parvularcula sp. LCG005]WOI52335.1 pentapeptide repeat-containing protein [Parvularcula sp. LCG005]